MYLIVYPLLACCRRPFPLILPASILHLPSFISLQIHFRCECWTGCVMRRKRCRCMLQAQAPALQLQQLRVLDCRCCDLFAIDAPSLPQLQTLGTQAYVEAAWHVMVNHIVVIDHTPARPRRRRRLHWARKGQVQKACLLTMLLQLMTLPLFLKWLLPPHLPQSLAPSRQRRAITGSKHIEAVLQLLANDIAMHMRPSVADSLQKITE
jgi:hypothetical protein